MPRAAALGVRSHSGWATLVAVGGGGEEPTVLLRRRLELADPEVPGSRQPYHAAEGQDLRDAEPYLRRCIATTRRLAAHALRAAVDELGSTGHRVAGCGLLVASGRPLPTLAKVLASHALIHAAEGEMYREAIRRAAAACRLAVVEVTERELPEGAAAALARSRETLAERLAEWGRRLGPPWRQDEKLAALAAWLALPAPGRRRAPRA